MQQGKARLMQLALLRYTEALMLRYTEALMGCCPLTAESPGIIPADTAESCPGQVQCRQDVALHRIPKESCLHNGLLHSEAALPQSGGEGSKLLQTLMSHGSRSATVSRAWGGEARRVDLQQRMMHPRIFKEGKTKGEAPPCNTKTAAEGPRQQEHNKNKLQQSASYNPVLRPPRRTCSATHQVRPDEHIVCRLDRNGRAAPDSDADISLGQRRRVIHAITHHRHHQALAFLRGSSSGGGSGCSVARAGEAFGRWVGGWKGVLGRVLKRS
jgi:hypothetical protein